ncbi:Arm DNA-binding domain-containing protein [Crocinitomix catalasitica]|uniref:Arm DNA-binding domain-containing protein n=1 Tax=Crocinitomix catalasitica TaxID=184607 RepID=UPI0004857492|nr:Arm DNA-binding domain-containing protein [Crocinitomix catalasitica]
MNAKYIYNRKNKLNSEGQALIQLEIYGDRKNRPLKSTGIYIAPDFWDDNRQIVKKKHPDSDTLNKKLNIFKTSWTSYLLKMEFQNNFIDWEHVKKINNVSETEQSCFIDFFENTDQDQLLGTRHIF